MSTRESVSTIKIILRIKIENTRVYTKEECGEINKSHKALGFDFEILRNKREFDITVIIALNLN